MRNVSVLGLLLVLAGCKACGTENLNRPPTRIERAVYSWGSINDITADALAEYGVPSPFKFCENADPKVEAGCQLSITFFLPRELPAASSELVMTRTAGNGQTSLFIRLHGVDCESGDELVIFDLERIELDPSGTTVIKVPTQGTMVCDVQVGLGFFEVEATYIIEQR